MASVAKRKWTSPAGEAKEAWIVRYLDRGGSHRQRTFERKRDADHYCRHVANELEAGTHIARREGRTVKEVAGDFLKKVDERVVAGRLRPCTARNYDIAFRLHIIPAFGATRINELRWQDVETWYHQIMRARALAPASAKRRMTFLKLLCDFAIRHGWAHRNPAVEAMQEIGPIVSKRIKTFQLHDVRQLLEFASGAR